MLHLAQVSQTNSAALKVDMYKAALETLVEVRREALGKAFALDSNGKSIGTEVGMRLSCLRSKLELSLQMLDEPDDVSGEAVGRCPSRSLGYGEGHGQSSDMVRYLNLTSHII